MKIIEVKNISKRFYLKPSTRNSTLGHLLDFFSYGRKKESWVLRDVSFDVELGEILGIIGPNGVGKSTLFRIIADIYRPDGGSIKVNGRVVSIIGLYYGLNQRLTMFDNITISCSLYGLPRHVIKEQIKNITEFSELNDYLHEPLYKFSSGMLARLIFSIAINCIINSEAKILLLDEVFAVGDIEFVNKSLNKLKEIFSGGLTVLIASHDLDAIARECSRTILIGNGGIIKDGKSQEVIEAYKKLANGNH